MHNGCETVCAIHLINIHVFTCIYMYIYMHMSVMYKKYLLQWWYHSVMVNFLWHLAHFDEEPGDRQWVFFIPDNMKNSKKKKHLLTIDFMISRSFRSLKLDYIRVVKVVSYCLFK